MAKVIVTDTKLTAIGNAIRSATGGVDPMTLDAMPTHIGTLTYTHDANATAAQILSGKTAYVKGSKVTGTIATKTSSNVTTSGNTVSIPAGYYASAVSKTVGTSKVAATYTPTTSNQTIKAGYYLSGDQTIKGDANLVAANIKSGTSIFGVTGTYDNSTPGITKGQGPYGANDVFVDGSSTGTISGILIDGFDAPVKISDVQTNSGIMLQNVQAPSLNINGNSNLTISLSENDFGSPTVSATNLDAANIKKGVSILGKTGTYTSDATATAAQILSGKTAYVNGAKVTGNMKTRGASTITPTTTNQTINSGVYLSGAQTIKGDANLIPGNIRSGVSIFGVTGTVTAGSTKYRHHIKCNITDYNGGRMEFDIINSTSTAYTDINSICDALERAGFGDYVNYTVASGYVHYGTKYIISAIGGSWGMFYEKLSTSPDSTSYTSLDIMSISNIIDTVTPV